MRHSAFFCLFAWLPGIALSVLPAVAQSTVNLSLTANAVPDECWKGLGLNGPPPVAVPPCSAPVIPKVNQSYVWSLATVNNHVWFGTTANALCTSEGEIDVVSAPGQPPEPFANPSWACEFGDSPYSTEYGGPLPPAFGDLRPPLFYMYNQQSGQVVNMTPYSGGVPVTQNTTGLRAVAAIGDLVLFAGPDLNGGIDFFAFQDSTQQFLGETNLAGYNDIRIFTQLNGAWYVGVGKTLGGGAVPVVSARWEINDAIATVCRHDCCLDRGTVSRSRAPSRHARWLGSAGCRPVGDRRAHAVRIPTGSAGRIKKGSPRLPTGRCPAHTAQRENENKKSFHRQQEFNFG